MPARVAAARVRMYCVGVGDCFLLTLPANADARARKLHVLIDCGTSGTDDAAAALMKRVARDIERETGGHLDVVVATHPMWDHVGGFVTARDVFANMTIGEVWLAWTESPGEAWPGLLRARRGAALRGLRAAARRVSSAARDEDRATQLHGVLDQFRAGPEADARDALELLVAHPSGPRVTYHRPARSPVPLGVHGARAYVLGPSSDVAALRGGPGQGDHGFASAAAFFAAAVGASSAEDADSAERRHAFEQRYRLAPEESGRYAIVRDRYGDPTERWRRIDADWLNAARQFALELDAHLNNSSLALAIELSPGGGVLLFPGDAQSSVWRTWGAEGWRIGGGDGRRITLADLLARTVVYKVSHHGGPSGTPLRDGLERMTAQRLIAMVPVDPKAATRVGWELPNAVLLDRLRRHMRGRVLLADCRVPERPQTVPEAEWAAYLGLLSVGRDALYVDHVFDPQ